MKKFTLVLIILGFLGCNNHFDCTYKAPVDKDDGLKVSTLKLHNLNESVFDNINQNICNGKYGNIHSLLIIHNNDLIVEQYYNGWESDRLHILASTTKSFNSILIGKAIELNKIESVNQKIFSFFPEYELSENDTLKAQITIENLLTMTAGFTWDELSLPYSNPENLGVKMDKEEDWLKASLNLSMDTIPGKKFVYCGPASIILAEIIKRATGQNIAEFAEQHLFNSLGINEYDWLSKNGVYDSGGGLKLKSRDIAKYGLLHLNKGNWNGENIVSENWIEKTFQPYIEINHPFYSCYQWRMVKTGLGFNVNFITGNGGQIIEFIPELDMVVVINADNREVSKEKITSLENLMQNINKIHPKVNNI